MTEPEGTLFQTWYRALTPDGKLWCESSSPGEVADAARMYPGSTLHRCEVRLVTGPWEPWEPPARLHLSQELEP